MVFFIMLYKVVLTFESVNEIIEYDHIIEFAPGPVTTLTLLAPSP